jgi:hypothetical protein
MQLGASRERMLRAIAALLVLIGIGLVLRAWQWVD